jgi:NDP-sugar pyrophosphorylase family protein
MIARGSRPTLRAGVIAAGRGERLRGAAGSLKPLVSVAGRPLVERVLDSLAEAQASGVVIIVNEDSRRVIDHVTSREWPFTLRWIVETTPSSMHSFLRVLEELARGSHDGDRVLISTVDTVATPGAYADFVTKGLALDVDVALAVTRPGPDDNPLLVRMNARTSTVDAIGPAVSTGSDTWMTAGYYLVRPTVLKEADAARRDAVPALRAFLARLVARGYRVAGVPVLPGVDVDRPGDVGEAEAFLRRIGA